MTSRDWHVHLGAHKTATTHIQMELAARQDELFSKGTFYLPLQQTRELLMFRNVSRPFKWRVLRHLKAMPAANEFTSAPFSQSCAKQLLAQIDEQAGTATRVLLSEENLLGNTAQVFGGGYFEGSARLNMLQSLSEQVPLHLYLSTRTLDEFLPSAYAQALRSIPASKLNLMKTIQECVLNPARWSILIRHIRNKIPNAKLTVWDYANYAANALAVQSQMTGCALDTRPVAAPPKRTRSPSGVAIALAEEILEEDPIKRLEKVNAIYSAYQTGEGLQAFNPLSDETREKLKMLYAQDLALIAALPNVNFIRY